MRTHGALFITLMVAAQEAPANWIPLWRRISAFMMNAGDGKWRIQGLIKPLFSGGGYTLED